MAPDVDEWLGALFLNGRLVNREVDLNGGAAREELEQLDLVIQRVEGELGTGFD